MRMTGYRKGEPITEVGLRALINNDVKVWAEYVDTEYKARRGLFFVLEGTAEETVMLDDGSSFALDFQFSGDDSAPCKDDDFYGGGISIFEAIKK